MSYKGIFWVIENNIVSEKKHPARDRIVRRYFARVRSYADIAAQRLLKEEGRKDIKEQQDEDQAGVRDIFAPLDNIRLEAVRQEVIRCKVSSVIDLGCGEGKRLDYRKIQSKYIYNRSRGSE